MVHGNIKAKNVLLDEQYEPRLSDFGLETLLQTPLQQSTGANNGYLAPEVANSFPRRRTQEGDVYSLGVLLLELLTGRQPDGNYDGGLPGWVQEMTQEKRSMELFDSNLVSMLNFPSAQDIFEFMGLARACVSRDAVARPSITIVLRTLESIVPGSTAPRSYVKDDNVDSDASISYRETTNNPFLTTYDAIPVEDDARDGDDEDGF
jgi:serine/threonine protein kinase